MEHRRSSDPPEHAYAHRRRERIFPLRFSYFLTVLAFCTISAFGVTAYVIIRATESRLDGAIESSCIRVNVERAKTNGNAKGNYFVDLTVYGFSIHPAQPIDAQQRQFEMAFLPKLRRAVQTERWTPLTDCRVAQNLGGRYASPASVRFADHLPPDSALDVTNAQRVAPAGSVR